SLPSAETEWRWAASQQFFQPHAAALQQQRAVQIALAMEAGGRVVHPKILDCEAFFDFLPPNRHGNRGVRLRPHGIDGRQRSSPGVLVVIDEYMSLGPVRDTIFRR